MKKKDVVERVDEDTFRVYLREKAQRNQANQKMLTLLSDYLGVPAEALYIVVGHHRPNKIIFMRNKKSV